jgi:hypothetical protein
MIFSLRVLGIELLGIRLGPLVHADDLTEWNGASHTSGSFERDTEPLSAIHEEPWTEEDSSKPRVGFGRW